MSKGVVVHKTRQTFSISREAMVPLSNLRTRTYVTSEGSIEVTKQEQCVTLWQRRQKTVD